MKVGILTASVSRNAGGLFWAIRSLAQSLLNYDCDIHVFGGEDGNTALDLPSWSNVPVSASSVFGPAAFGFQPRLLSSIHSFQPNLLHVHGLWMYPSLACKLWANGKHPYVISPHGMLDRWAIKNSAWKKKLAGLVFERSHLRNAGCIHALCEEEHDAIRAFGLKNPVAIIPNGIELPDLNTSHDLPEWRTSLRDSAKILLFLGRLHPKKGLSSLIEAWSISKKSGTESNDWHLVIAGWDQSNHQAELESQTLRLGLQDSVHFIGPQFEHDKAATFRCVDGFILPSLSEGLPMAILEAWAYQLPVLMSPQCNLPIGYANNAAIKIEPEQDSIAGGLITLFLASDSERRQLACNGRKLVEKEFTWSHVAEQMANVYQWVLTGNNKPSFIRTL